MNDPDSRKPCIALMGEFSAGKSTLANLLIGYDPLPVQVIATQLPPVRIVHGEGTPFQVGLDGCRVEVDLTGLDRTQLKDVAYLQIFSQEEMLRHCDLIDMPGISDPNMPAEVWERMMGDVDGVLWCSPATQAWRQSEAAVWSDLPEKLYSRSLLLLTRMDKLTTPADRDRVIGRVRQETEGLFAKVLPISLLLATREQDDFTVWQQSGAEELAQSLIAILSDINGDGASEELRDMRVPALEIPEGLAPVADQAPPPSQPVLVKRPTLGAHRTARPA